MYVLKVIETVLAWSDCVIYCEISGGNPTNWKKCDPNTYVGGWFEKVWFLALSIPVEHDLRFSSTGRGWGHQTGDAGSSHHRGELETTEIRDICQVLSCVVATSAVRFVFGIDSHLSSSVVASLGCGKTIGCSILPPANDCHVNLSMVLPHKHRCQEEEKEETPQFVSRLSFLLWISLNELVEPTCWNLRCVRLLQVASSTSSLVF